MRNQYKRERERDGEKNNDVTQHISEEFDISQQQQKKSYTDCNKICKRTRLSNVGPIRRKNCTVAFTMADWFLRACGLSPAV